MVNFLVALMPDRLGILYARLDMLGQWILLAFVVFVLFTALILLRKIWLLLKIAYRDSQFAARFFAHNSLQEACNNLRMKATPVSRMFVAGLIEWNYWKKHPNAPPGNRWQGVAHAMEFQADIESAELRRGLSILRWIAGLAPMLGLTGALWRLMAGFGTIAPTSTSGLPVLAQPMADALLLLVTGILVGLAAHSAYVLIHNYIKRFMHELAKQNERFVSWAYR